MTLNELVKIYEQLLKDRVENKITTSFEQLLNQFAVEVKNIR